MVKHMKISAAVDPEVLPFLHQLNSGEGPPIEQLPAVEARKVLASVQSSVRLTLPAARVSHKVIPAGEAGGTVTLTIVRPFHEPKALPPAFMFFHGGGWVLGDFPTHERMVRDLVVLSGGAVAVFVNYTPSPEAQYGEAILQAYEATKWVAKHGREIRVDGTRLAVAGNSVGGNMATVVALMAKHQRGPRLRAQVLFWPVTDSRFDTPSYKEFADGYFLSRNMMKWFWDSYTMNAKLRKEITASPIRATVKQLAGLPPALIQTAECDVLREEGEAYGRKLSEAGVAVTSVRFNGMIHDFGLLNAISTVPAVRSSLQQAGAYLRLHLA